MIALFTFLVIAACWPTCRALHEAWTGWHDTSYTHGYLIALVCAWLMWRKNRAFVPVDREARLPALTALLAASLAWVFAVRSGVGVVQWVLFPLILLLTLWAALGSAVARRNLFPVGYLYFAMPLWGIVNGIFLWGTVYVVRGLLRLVDVPAHFIGNSVQIPSGTFEIAGGCSGLHYAIVAFALGALMGELRADDWRTRLKLLAVAGILAVIANWVRVFIIILVGHLTHMQHPLVAQHEAFGWMLFVPAMALFFLAERYLPIRAAGRASPSQPPGLVTTGILFPAGAVGVLTIAAGLQWLSARPALAELSRVAAPGWSESQTVSGGSWAPVVAGADAQQVTVHVSPDGRAVERREYLFLTQAHKKELGNYSNSLFEGMQVLGMRSGPAGSPVVLAEADDTQGIRWLVGATYSAGGRTYASPVAAQIRYAALSLRHLRSAPGSVTLWRTVCSPDCDSAQEALQEFIVSSQQESTL